MRLSKGAHMRTPFFLLKATAANYNGIRSKVFEEDPVPRFCNFSTYGGTEKEVDGVGIVEDTAQVVAWYDPVVTAGDRIRLESGAIYEIKSPPENLEEAGQMMQFKVARVKGGA